MSGTPGALCFKDSAEVFAVHRGGRPTAFIEIKVPIGPVDFAYILRHCQRARDGLDVWAASDEVADASAGSAMALEDDPDQLLVEAGGGVGAVGGISRACLSAIAAVACSTHSGEYLTSARQPRRARRRVTSSR